ncbi:DUF3291 domain-containing protein [Paenibacillus sp. FJAT-26967]|uniref:DUF3291 domain-containing protein n=1 Tax=Paenibacillus sp. FJAT-26967 TaxID=1729690 RepID=UPI00083933D7|nr:DUF3291 domain-containing protein [Paenibacillus sp. FJAT-26967]
MARVAFTTFAIMKQPYGHQEVQGFEDLTPPVFEVAEDSPGFIARAKETDDLTHLTNFERDWGEWGAFSVPRFYTGGFTMSTDTRASTLSLWEDIDSVYQFVYKGLHLTALKQRHEWFVKPEWPTYAMWYAEEGEIPTWEEASRKLELLHDNGPTLASFDFKQLFDESGNPFQIRPKVSQDK